MKEIEAELDKLCGQRDSIRASMFTEQWSHLDQMGLDGVERQIDELEVKLLQTRLSSMDLTPYIIQYMIAYLNGDCHLSTFRTWFYLTTWNVEQPFNLIGKLKLALAESSGGYCPEETLKAVLRRILWHYVK